MSQAQALWGVGICLLGSLGFFTLLFVRLVQFRNFLESTHREIWQSLGSPGLFNLAGGISQKPPLHWYVLWRRYRSAGDVQLTKMGDAAFWPLVAFYIFGVAYLGFSFVRVFI